MPFKRPLARREIIGFSVIALCLIGVIVVGVMLLTTDDTSDGDETRTTITTTDITDPKNRAPGDVGVTPGSQNDIKAKPPARAPRRPVQAPDVSAEVVEKGQLPPSLNAKIGKALADGKLTTGDLKGTPTVLTALNTRCEFCGPEARLLEAEWKRWGPRGVLYLDLSVRESADSARVLADQYKLTFPVVSDRSGSAAKDFKLSGIPETLFISADGTIVGRVVGGASIGQLEAGSSAARGDRPYGVQQGGARVPL
jgi:peroxiredoxin